MRLFKRKALTKTDEKMEKNIMQMVTTYGESFYNWNGKLYESDIVR